jgi:ribosome-associated toxin RatA of RatAB toxin-antitoxin module
MVSINTSREVSARVDRVWDIVADVDNEPEYWHGTKTVRNISKSGNIIEREVTIAFRDSKCRQTVVLDPKKTVKITMTEGPLQGIKTVTLEAAGGNKTLIGVAWDVKLTGFLGMFSGVLKNHISKGSEEALERIAKAVE